MQNHTCDDHGPNHIPQQVRVLRILCSDRDFHWDGILLKWKLRPKQTHSHHHHHRAPSARTLHGLRQLHVKLAERDLQNLRQHKPSNDVRREFIQHFVHGFFAVRARRVQGGRRVLNGASKIPYRLRGAFGQFSHRPTFHLLHNCQVWRCSVHHNHDIATRGGDPSLMSHLSS